ncbi:MAG: AAA family ATPase [Lachnospiraceae bacterium]|nr:AAA family ATPase [Lachnospiraceae bacterium]
MQKLLLIMGDIAAGKTTFSRILSERYHVAVFQKDTVKEILGDHIGFHNREENKKLSDATIAIMCHTFSQIAKTGNSVILEANFHEVEQQKLHEIARENQYEVLTLVLRGDEEVLYQRYLHRMNEEQRHPVHLSTTLHIREDFLRIARYIRNEVVIGKVIVIEATDFGYQRDEELLKKIDAFMDFSCL